LAVLLAAVRSAATKLPRPFDAPGHLPDAKTMATSAVLGLEVLVGIALPQIFGIDKSLTVFDEGQVEVDVADHLGDGAAVAIGV
jgi:hypothetical protein